MRKALAKRESSHTLNALRDPVHEWAVILAGGDGMRLRELSYKISGDHRPKQFCKFFGGKSLLAHTRDRLQLIFREEKTFFVLNRAHRTYYSSELSDVASSQKLIQPANRGTAPAIALAVLEILQRDPDATIALFPSDHHYLESSIFRATVDRALRLAVQNDDRVLIVGAPATYPEVEYGWIQPGANAVQHLPSSVQYVTRFWEKPSLADARRLQNSGCLWNTFVTIGSGGAFLELLAATVPHLLAAIGSGPSATALDQVYLEIEPIDFSRDVLSLAPERLLVLRDGPSGWTDFGSPERAMDVLQAQAAS